MEIRAVYEPDENLGFIYTIDRKDAELYTDNLPRSLVAKMAGLMNFMNKRELRAGQTIRSNGILALAIKVPPPIRALLQEKNTLGADPAKDIFLLVPITEGGQSLKKWPVTIVPSAA
jgi:hypothetical protein